LKRFYDTSVLVAAFQRNHTLHDRAIHVLLKASPKDGYCAAHSLAEFYSVMTRIPVRPRILPEQCNLMIASLLERVSLVALNAGEYRATIEACAETGLSGGIIYDALLMSCARKAAADVIFTFNPKHFNQVAPDWERRIEMP